MKAQEWNNILGTKETKETTDTNETFNKKQVIEVIKHFITDNEKAVKLITEAENKLNELDLQLIDKDLIITDLYEALYVGFHLGLTYVFTDLDILSNVYLTINDWIRKDSNDNSDTNDNSDNKD